MQLNADSYLAMDYERNVDMTVFYKNGKGLPMAHAVDIKRASRKLRDLLKIDSLSEAQNLMAQLLGANNYHEVLTRSEDPDISNLTPDEARAMVEVEAKAGSKGEFFPKNLPSALGKPWQAKALALSQKAIGSLSGDYPEFVAIVGGSERGKTLLAKHLVATRGGKLIDGGLHPVDDRTRPNGKGEVLVFDQKANLPKDRPFMGPLSLWQPGAPNKRRLSMYKELARGYYLSIPDDEPGLGGQTIREWVRENPQVTLVLVFSNVEAARKALQGSLITYSASRGALKTNNWYKAHVIDLDNMQYVELDGPSLT